MIQRKSPTRLRSLQKHKKIEAKATANEERLAKKAAAKLTAVNAERPDSEEAKKEQERKQAIIAAAIARAAQQK